ncbi:MULTISPECIES: hypothetical protein [Rhodococcus]|uniref:hypothetical protein n=1 Tax=Rhodococcus TaxID=1827 RepID=UPI00193C6651|nr:MULTISPECIES: hypothetical protein [Rhodococcus]QRI76046.1 hypothetical protein JQ505_26825 [Rhodococcus aetherivorans]QSE59457.1 hypothetical protein JYA75_27925 [Rhodococcus sp. PSBB066]
MSRRYREPGIEIESYTSITDDYAGAHDSWWGVAKMHVKAQDHDLPFLLANELICCRLAAAIGLPVLPGEIALHPNGRKCWVTSQVSHAGVTVPPTRGQEVVAAHAPTIAGALVFDCWVLNEDRHEENFLFHPSLGIWLIDHDDALAGSDGRRFNTFAKTTDMTLGWHGFQSTELPLEALRFWAWRVKNAPMGAIDLALNEANARGLLPKANGATLRKLLRDRKERIDTLVDRFVAPLRSYVGTDDEPSLFQP